MFRLTREVRFALDPDDPHPSDPRGARNGFGGVPAVSSLLSRWIALQVTLEGTPDAHSSYLRNIKEIDEVARRRAIPFLAAAKRFADLRTLHGELAGAWPGAELHSLRLQMSPCFAIETRSTELPMMRLSQKFEFSASHRLHNPALDESANRRTYGKCSNPHGHGHNYELEVTLRGEPDANGLLMPITDFERVVIERVIERLDHKNLNVEVSEFAKVIPSVENIARVIHDMLCPHLKTATASLATVTVWETPKTWCEYGS